MTKVDLATFNEKVKKMADDGIASGSQGNNPVVPTAEAVVELYHRTW